MVGMKCVFGRVLTVVCAACALVCDAHAQRELRHEAVIDAPVAEVWRVFSTSEGWKSLGVAQADVDLRIGGRIRTHYDPAGALGDAQSIEQEILSFEPERMLSFRNVKAPEGFPHAGALGRTWSVCRFEPLGADRTRVTLTGMGWGDDEQSRAGRAFFEAGNAHVLGLLVERYAGEDGEARNGAAERLLARLAGGEWIHENVRDDGGVFRVRSVYERGPDGVSVSFKGWLGDAGGMFHHGSGVAHRAAAGGGLRFVSVNERGNLAAGAIGARGDDTLVWEWTETSLAGVVTAYTVAIRFLGDDVFRLMIDFVGGDGAQRLVDIEMRRVERAPAAFLRMKGAEATGMSDRIESWTDGAVTVRAMREGPASRWSSFEVVVPESAQGAWDRWTTAEGMQTFLAPAANVELREGGLWEALFFPSKPAGQRGAEGVYFRTIDAPRSFSVQWNAPPQFPTARKEGFRARVAFEAIDHASTRVRVTLDEFKEGEEWDGTYAYFLEAWPVVLNRCRRACVEGAMDWSGR